MRSLLLVGLLYLFISCGKKVDVNKEFTLKYGKTTTVVLNGGEKLKIALEKIEESRCAPNVQCIWEGFANVYLKVGQEHDTLGLLQSPFPQLKSHGSFEVQLIELNYSSDNDFGKQEKASVKLKINQ